MTSSLTRRLVKLLQKPIGSEDRDRASLHLLDWLACSVSGWRSSSGEKFAKYSRDAQEGPNPIIGGKSVASAETAAFCNGGLGNVLEMDDIHKTAILHPGPVIIPAALAAAFDRNCSPKELLDAIVKGYEATIRLGRSLGSEHYKFWHNTSSCGAFGASVAVGNILNLSEDQLVWALGNASTQASGLWRCRHEPVMTKQFHTAHAARSGYTSALLAYHNFTGPEFILEGEQGFFDAMCPDGEPELIIEEPNSRWQIWETSFKPWPACRHAHAAIDAALELKNKKIFKNKNLSEIRVRTYSDAKVFCENINPESTIEAKFSFEHSVAIALIYGKPMLEHFQPLFIENPVIDKLRKITKVDVDRIFDDRYPKHFGSAVDIVLSDGTKYSSTVLDALGDPENALKDSELISKAVMLFEAAKISTKNSNKLIGYTISLNKAESLYDFKDKFLIVNSNLLGR